MNIFNRAYRFVFGSDYYERVDSRNELFELLYKLDVYDADPFRNHRDFLRRT